MNLKRIKKPNLIWYTGIEPDWGNIYYHRKDDLCHRLVFRKKQPAFTGYDIDRRRFICRNYKEDELAEKAGHLFRTMNKYYNGEVGDTVVHIMRH